LEQNLRVETVEKQNQQGGEREEEETYSAFRSEANLVKIVLLISGMEPHKVALEVGLAGMRAAGST
jgi:hypothetical protein